MKDTRVITELSIPTDFIANQKVLGIAKRHGKDKTANDPKLKGISKISRPTFKTKPGEIRRCVFTKGLKRPQVSNRGRFRSSRGVVTRPKPRKSKYVRVSIMNSMYGLHALICRAFRGPSATSEHTVDHIDNNPSNNNVENLRWFTKSEQIKHSYATNPKRGSSAGRQSKPVLGRKVGDDVWTSYDSAAAAGRELSLDPGNISGVCRGKAKSIGGYEFCLDKPKEIDTLPGEQWHDVVSGDGPYEVIDLAERMLRGTWPQVSSMGRFRSTRGVVTRPKPKENGYVPVSIMNSMYGLHALICRAFRGPPASSEHTTDHIDNNPSNNNVENLRWLTRSQQIKHSYATNPQRESSAGRMSKPVLGRKVGDNVWTPYDSGMAAARELSLDPRSISGGCRGELCKTGDYEFRFKEEEEVIAGEEWRDVVMQ